MRRDQVLGALVAILGFGLAAALVVLFHLSSVVDVNRDQLHRQDAATQQLAGAVAAAQQDASTQRQLVQALQRQVRRLGGHPLTAPPTAPPAAAGQPASPRPGATPSATPRPSPRATPRPSPTPTPSPSPRPSPSPSVCIAHITCLPIGSR